MTDDPYRVNADHVLHTVRDQRGRRMVEKLLGTYLREEDLVHARMPAFLIAVDRLLAQHGGHPLEDEDRDHQDEDDEDGDDAGEEDDEDGEDPDQDDSAEASLSRMKSTAMDEEADHIRQAVSRLFSQHADTIRAERDRLEQMARKRFARWRDLEHCAEHARMLHDMADLLRQERGAVESTPWHARELLTLLGADLSRATPMSDHQDHGDMGHVLREQARSMMLACALQPRKDWSRIMERAAHSLRIGNHVQQGRLDLARNHIEAIRDDEVSHNLVPKELVAYLRRWCTPVSGRSQYQLEPFLQARLDEQQAIEAERFNRGMSGHRPD